MTLDLKISQPLEYYRQFLEKDVRPDGRALGEFRQTYIKLNPIESTADGSALIKIGNTSVICGVKAELFEPLPDDDPECGRVIPNVELNAGCSPAFRPGAPSETAQVASQMIADILATSGVIDCRSLCVSAGKLAWILYCDVICLDLDGNLFDACLLSVMAALSATSLPQVAMDETSKVVTVEMTGSGIGSGGSAEGGKRAECVKRTPLGISDIPVASSFSVFDGGILLADAASEEEELCLEGSLTVVTTKDSVVVVHKPGGVSLPTDKVQTCVETAFLRTKSIQKLLNDAVKSQLSL